MSLPNLLPATSAFIQRAPRMLIGGDWVEAADGQTMPLRNPATGEQLCLVPRATVDDVDRAVLAARRAFDASAIDYITKPIEPGRFQLALERARRATELQDGAQRIAELEEALATLRRTAPPRGPAELWVKTQGHYARIACASITTPFADGPLSITVTQGSSLRPGENSTPALNMFIQNDLPEPVGAKTSVPQ